MEYSKILIRAEMCTVGAAMLEGVNRTRAEKLNAAIARKVRSTPAPSTGKPLVMHGDTVHNLRVDQYVIMPDEDGIRRYEEYYSLGDAVPVCAQVMGIIFETGNKDDVESVMHSLVDDPEVAEFDGFCWKWFDPEVDIPAKD